MHLHIRQDWRRGLENRDYAQLSFKTEETEIICSVWLDGHEFEQSPEVGDGQGKTTWTGLCSVGEL